MNRRAQAAVEFLILLGFMLLVFTLFFLIINERASQSTQRAALGELASIGGAVRDEVTIAARVHDGYNRTFVLPLSVQRGTYTITLLPNGSTDQPSEIALADGQVEYLVFLPVNLTPGSTIGPGYNQVARRDGNITVRSVPKPTGCSWSTDCLPGTVCVAGSCVACVDNDGDAYASETSPVACVNTDCDDNDALANPGLPEDCADPADNDCDNLKDSDDPDCSAPCAGCLIGGTCYADGQADPDNTCQYCNPEVDPGAWTPQDAGTVCDDGLYCTTSDQCDGAGACSGVARSCTSPTPFCDDTLDACVECLSVSDCSATCEEVIDEGADPATYSITYSGEPVGCSLGQCAFLGLPDTCYGPSPDLYSGTISDWCHDAQKPTGCCDPSTFDCPK